MSQKSLTLTKIPYLNQIVLKQKGVRFFVAAPDCFIIDKTGFLELIRGALSVDFIAADELDSLAGERIRADAD